MKTFLTLCLVPVVAHLFPLAGAQPGQELWEFHTAGPVWSSPAIGADGTLYVWSGDGVHALNGATGHELWDFQYNSNPNFCPAIGADGTVYVGGGMDGKVYALNGATGQKRWEFQDGDWVGFWPNFSLAIGADGTVYVGSGDKKVYALNGATGQKRWESQPGGGVSSSAAIGADGTVYVGSDDGKVYALNGATGQKRWESATGGSESFRSSPAVGADGTVYVGSNDGKLYALNGATGQKLWEFATGGPVWSPAIGTDGTVYVGGGSPEFKVYALCSSSVGGLAQSSWPKFRGNAANQGRVKPTLRIVSQSGATMVLAGKPLVLEVVAYGNPPFSYEWFFNGQLLAGVTGPKYELAAFAASQAGVYRARVRNAEGLAESAEMVVTLA